MCGLYGYSTKEKIQLTKKQSIVRSQILTGLAVAMQERGTHSTGVAGICNSSCSKHDWISYKRAVDASTFVKGGEYKKFIKHQPRVVIGHTRYATSGIISDENAHPFIEGSIVGAHNGHVSNSKDVFQDGQVDSQAIFYALDKAKNDFELAFEQLYGKFAITWFSQLTTDKVHLVREENPLSVAYVRELQTYFWCSLRLPLEAILSSHFDLSKIDVWTPKQNMVYTIGADNQIERKQVKFKTWYSSSTSSNQKQSYYSSNQNFSPSDDEDKEILQIAEKTDRTDSQWLIIKNLPTPHLQLMLEGSECSMCNKAFDYDNDTLYWHSKEKLMMCWKCGNDLGDWDDYLYLTLDDLDEIGYEIDEREYERSQYLEAENERVDKLIRQGD